MAQLTVLVYNSTFSKDFILMCSRYNNKYNVHNIAVYITFLLL